MTQYYLTFQAKADLHGISKFIAQESPAAARRVRQELRTAMKELAAEPAIGHLRQDLSDEPLRFWGVYSYLIIYRPETKPLQVIRIPSWGARYSDYSEGKL